MFLYLSPLANTLVLPSQVLSPRRRHPVLYVHVSLFMPTPSSPLSPFWISFQLSKVMSINRLAMTRPENSTPLRPLPPRRPYSVCLRATHMPLCLHVTPTPLTSTPMHPREEGVENCSRNRCYRNVEYVETSSLRRYHGVQSKQLCSKSI